MTSPDFSLYLRAFATTNVFTKNLSIHHPVSLARIDASSGHDLERVLMEAISNFSWGPLVALGKPGEHTGAGRILTTDAKWKEDAALLCSSAHTIILVPAPNDGTLWEVEHIKKHKHFKKTIFVLPPFSHFDYSSSIDTETFISGAIAGCSDRAGLHLPITADGAVFAFADDLTVRKFITFPRLTVADWMHSLSYCRY